MTAIPGAAAIHESLECSTLLVVFRKVIEPDDDIVICDVVVIQVCQVCGCIKGKVLLACDQVKEVQGILREIDVVHFTFRGIESGHFEAWLL